MANSLGLIPVGDPSTGVRLKIDTRDVEEMIARLPKVANAEFNRCLGRIRAGFYKLFHVQLLRGGAGIHVKRKIGGGGKGRKKVPREAPAMGFRGIIKGHDKLSDKTLVMFSKAPPVEAHEFGAEIHGRPLLFIRGRTKTGRVKIRLRGKGFGTQAVNVIVARVAQVKLKPRLGFYRAWSDYLPTAQKQVDKTAVNLVKRMEGAAKAGRGAGALVAAEA